MTDDRPESGGSDSPTEDLSGPSLYTGTPDPERIGPYRIVRRIGEGGMGVVYEAEQEEPIRRRVALKLIRAGLDTRQVIARFESERQALARMSHSNVARVLDAGTTEQGLPYFVMEYVDGVPITRYCDTRRLSTTERLELFMQVCVGVQHAHQKGIIHRDLKPSNVLVATEDGKPVPKIIDFGLAKATEQRLTERTLFTQMGVLVGTPAYMSPEQADLDAEDIDTRTDVYSLAVLLYELLVGARPFEMADLTQAALGEILRRIREDEPPKPSTRLQSLGDASLESAQRRHSDPISLARELRGDLDWITMKALEKDRARRYDSPSDLARDVERHLQDQPVVAGPPSAAYRMRKFVRRHRVGVTAATLVAATLVLGIVGTTIGFVRSVRAEQLARDEAERANVEASTATQVSNFLVEMFEESDPEQARGREITVREALDKAAERLERELGDQPVVRARLMSTLGKVYTRLGLFEEADPLLHAALQTHLEILGEEHLDTATSLVNLGRLYDFGWKGEKAKALPLLERGLAVREKLLGPNHLDVAEPLVYMGAEVGDRDLEVRQRALAILEANLGHDHPRTLGARNDVALSWSARGDAERARELHEQNIAIGEARGMADPAIILSLVNLADFRATDGDFEGAIVLGERAVAVAEKVYGVEHPTYAGVLSALGERYRQAGDFEQARATLERSIAIWETLPGGERWARTGSLVIMAQLLVDVGEHEEARAMYERALEVGSDVRAFRGLSKLDLIENKPDEAAAVLMRAVTFVRDELSEKPNSPERLQQLHNLAYDFQTMKRYDDAEELYRETLERRRHSMGDDNPATLYTLHALAFTIRLQQRYDEAASMFLEALEARKRVLGEDHIDTLWAKYNLATTYASTRIQRYDEAERLHRETLDGRRRVFGGDHPLTLQSMQALAMVYWNQDRYDEAEPLLVEALESTRRVLGDDHPETSSRFYNLACLEALRGNRAKALEWLRQAVKAGFSDAEWMVQDSDLASLHGDPDFETIVAEVKKRIEEGRETSESGSPD